MSFRRLEENSLFRKPNNQHGRSAGLHGKMVVPKTEITSKGQRGKGLVPQAKKLGSGYSWGTVNPTPWARGFLWENERVCLVRRHSNSVYLKHHASSGKNTSRFRFSASFWFLKLSRNQGEKRESYYQICIWLDGRQILVQWGRRQKYQLRTALPVQLLLICLFIHLTDINKYLKCAKPWAKLRIKSCNCLHGKSTGLLSVWLFLFLPFSSW